MWSDSLIALRILLLLDDRRFMDSRELGRALIAWKHSLSHDEVFLLEYIADGLTNDEIAGKLDVAEEKTVKGRIQRLYSKLHVTGRVQAAVVATQYGLVAAKATRPQAE
jgi:DNA-binding NarL/FixJ family response regulator